jgi:peptidoglycan/LPS O-acetylase OafA/YrhL
LKSQVPTAPVNKMYFPQLDSVRGLSFIFIFLFHALRIDYDSILLGDFFRYLFSNFPLAIDVFFILSSFLLTYLAMNEYQRRGNFSFRNYFKRRVLRIWPLYYFIMLLAFVLFPLAAKLLNHTNSLPEPIYYLFFIANFYTAAHVFFLQFLWTISVEEQFYLLWGAGLRFFEKRLYAVIGSLFLISISFSMYALLNDVKSYFNTLTYLFDFGLGALAAILFFKKSREILWLSDLSKTSQVLFYGYLIPHFILFYFLNKYTNGDLNEFVGLVNRYIMVIYVSLLISELVINEKRTRIFEKNRFLIYTGKISYGLYCFHGITITFINILLQYLNFEVANGLLVIIYFAVNYFIAYTSYTILEMPFLRLKAKWSRI